MRSSGRTPSHQQPRPLRADSVRGTKYAQGRSRCALENPSSISRKRGRHRRREGRGKDRRIPEFAPLYAETIEQTLKAADRLAAAVKDHADPARVQLEKSFQKRPLRDRGAATSTRVEAQAAHAPTIGPMLTAWWR